MNADFYGIKPYGATPNELQIKMYEIGKKAFFHFGVNTFSNVEWGDGKESASLFNPTDIDVKSWIRDVKSAGFKMAILTAKHHDGFCLWPSKYTEHSVKNSPYKNGMGDIVKEFTDACREYGLKVGIYVSPWDRNAPSWGTAEYTHYYVNQLKEILTGYGEIDEIWWDGAGSSNAVYDYGLWAYTVKKYQPNCLINSRIGNGMGDYGSSGDNETDAKGNGMLYEVPATLNDTWGYKAYDQNWKDAETVLNIKNELNARGINYLLNVGPDPLGRIPARSVEILKEIGRK